MSNIFERAGDSKTTTNDVRNTNNVPDNIKDKDVDSYMFAKTEEENVRFHISEGLSEKEAKELARAERRNAEREAKIAAERQEAIKKYM